MVSSTGSRFGPILIFIAALLWALDGFLRQSLYTLDPLIIVLFEHAVGVVFLLPVVVRVFIKDSLTLKEWGVVMLVSVLSGLLGTLMFTSALVKVFFISISVVYLLQKLQPVFAITTAVIFLREPLPKQFVLWSGLALLAAFFVTFPNGFVDFAAGGETVTAALLALGAAAAWGSSTTFSKIALSNQSSTSITALRFFFTTIAAVIAVFITQKTALLVLPTFSQSIRFVMIALSTGMVALWLYYKGLKHTPARISTIIELTFPLMVVFLDGWINSTTLVFSQYLAACVLLFAMYKVSKQYVA